MPEALLETRDTALPSTLLIGLSAAACISSSCMPSPLSALGLRFGLTLWLYLYFFFLARSGRTIVAGSTKPSPVLRIRGLILVDVAPLAIFRL